MNEMRARKSETIDKLNINVLYTVFYEGMVGCAAHTHKKTVDGKEISILFQPREWMERLDTILTLNISTHLAVVVYLVYVYVR